MNRRDPMQWFVIQTKPGNEQRANTNLLNQEIETFLPLYRAHQYRNGRLMQRIKPLFPSYLFAKLDLLPHYDRVKWTRGVRKILGNREGPLPISENVIKTIRERMGEDKFVKLDDELKDVRFKSLWALKDLMASFRRDIGWGRVILPPWSGGSLSRYRSGNSKRRKGSKQLKSEKQLKSSS
jgi:transcriptional antiterminator RfaH